jgi:CheY-like chemotaxis protein
MNAGQYTILLVEDDRFLRRATEATLKKNGFVTVTASDGEEGLQKASTSQPDLILLDLIMPKMDGFEVLKKLKDQPQTQAIPVVVLSNLGQEADVAQCLQSGAVAHYVKSNLSLKEMVGKIHELLEQKTV